MIRTNFSKGIFISKRKCFECGEPATERHHVIPKVKGGKRTIPLCALCHGKVHSIERVNISTLIKQALRKKKLREPEWKAGTNNLSDAGRRKAHMTNYWNARKDPKVLAAWELIKPLKEQGMTFQQIADRLNEENYRTRKNKLFKASTVWYICNKLNNENADQH